MKNWKICVLCGTETMMTLLSFHNTRDYITDRHCLTRPTLIMSLAAADSVAVCQLHQEQHFLLIKQQLRRSEVLVKTDSSGQQLVRDRSVPTLYIFIIE